MQDAILQTEGPLEIPSENTALNYAPPVDVQVTDIAGLDVVPPYLDSEKSNEGCKLKFWDEIREKIRPATLCGKYAITGIGQTTYRKYYKFLTCNKWFCGFCGKKGGIIHKRRMAKIIDKIGGYPKGTVLRQVIFTVPENIVESFGSRAALNLLFKMSEKIIKKAFPGLKCVAYLHLFGDKGIFRFHPHINIHIFDKPGTLKMLPQEILDAMREAWRLGVQSYVRQPVSVVNIKCGFATEPGQIKHRIKYMSRPCPGPKEYAKLKRDIPLLYFCTVVLSGFMFIRYFNGCRSKGMKDASRKEELRAAVGLAGEKITWDFQIRVSRAEFDFIYRPGDYDELSPGNYRIHGP